MKHILAIFLALCLCSPLGASRSFVAASSQGTKFGGLIQAYPVTVAFWIKLTSVPATTSVPWSISNGTSNAYIQIAITDSKYTAVDLGGASQVTTNNAATTGVWQHLCVVFLNASSRSIYLDGDKATNSSAGGWGFGSANAGGLGQFWNGAVDANYTDALISEFAIWNVALTDADVGALKAGASSLKVRPSGLQSYFPLVGNSLNGIAFTASALTNNSSTASAEEPRIYR